MHSLLAYIPIAAMMVIIPGADTMLVMKNTLRYGPKAGRYNILGLATGLSFWTVIAILGLSVVIAKSVILFTTIKYLGAAYLIYLGVKSFFAKSMFSLDDMQSQAKNMASSRNVIIKLPLCRDHSVTFSILKLFWCMLQSCPNLSI